MSRQADVRAEISNFRIFYGENIYKAWERYKDIIRKCPNHGEEIWGVLQTFYKGIDHTSQSHLDFAAGTGTLESRYEIIESNAECCLHWPLERINPVRKPGMLELDKQIAMEAQLAALMNEVKSLKADINHPKSNVLQLTAPESEPCSACGDQHDSTDCPSTALVCYAENFGSRNFNQARDKQYVGRNNNPNFRAFDQQRRPSNAPFPRDEQRISALENYVKEYVTRNDAIVRNIESHLGQIAVRLNTGVPGKLPGDTEVPSTSSPEQIKTITLRSGRVATQASNTSKTTTISTEEEPNKPVEASPSISHHEQHQKQAAGQLTENQGHEERTMTDEQTQAETS
ncbi:uncharacterized protein LOC133299954 [Gastrolobium bilobum]|uniref:uncharacterized protein LOC133299954 n=1 Tax=Gastrolobium bilobum TaxID=150636 RepID=UPI002AB1B767|nr:uncharacterized protein LOC133299954 [Gastrolobium bilobum]